MKQKQTKRHQQQEKVVVPPTLTVESVERNSLYKPLFFFSIVAMLAMLWIVGFDSAYHSDEMDMNAYGRANIAYYTSGGTDTSYKKITLDDGTELPAVMQYYGTGFEYIATGIVSLLGVDGVQEYNVRHMVNQLFAILAVLFTGLTARRMANSNSYRPALIAAWLLFLTPFFFGNAIFNTKDIPFLTGYIACIYYLICFLETLSQPAWKHVIGFMLALAFTLSVRIGGVLILVYLGLFLLVYWRFQPGLKDTLIPFSKNWLPKLLTAVGGAFLITVAFWPFLLEAPFANMVKAINVAKDFPQRIPIIFEGEYVDSLSVPARFLPKYMFITIPVLILLLIIASIVYILRYYPKFQWRIVALVAFASLFPLFYAMYSTMPVYNAWRHMLFIYPGLIAIAGVGFHTFLNLLQRPAYQWALAGVCAIALMPATIWIFKTGSYSHMYYNEWSGGFSEMYYKYESDYWQMSIKEGVDWLVVNEKLDQRKDSIDLATNAYSFVHHYVKHRYPGVPIKVVRCGYRKRFFSDWEYGIFNVIFLTPQTLEYSFPPRNSTLHTINVAERPICAVISDSVRLDRQGLFAFDRGDFKTADSIFNQYLRSVQFDISGTYYMEALVPIIGFTYLANNKLQEAMNFATKGLQHEPNDYFANLTMGILKVQQGQPNEARLYLEKARTINPNDIYAAQYLAQLGVKTGR